MLSGAGGGKAGPPRGCRGGLRWSGDNDRTGRTRDGHRTDIRMYTHTQTHTHSRLPMAAE